MNDESYLAHVGVGHDDNPPGRGSGRFPYGSGENPNQREAFSNGFVKKMLDDGSTRKDIGDLMKKSGFSEIEIYRNLKKADWKETEIAEALGMKTTKLRAKVSIANREEKAAKINEVLYLHDQGLSNMEVSRRTGIPEPTVRNYLNPTIAKRNDVLTDTANTLKDLIAEKDYIDIGPGSELSLSNVMGQNITSTKLSTAVAMLEEEGYKKYWIPVEQLGTGKNTTVTVLCPPGTNFPDVNNNRDKIRTIEDYILDDSENITKLGIRPPTSVDSNRIMVRYAEEGGKDKDGVIELRRGVEDLSLGASSYAQVRIAVDGTHYLKGMAVYADDADFPPGKDIIFNTNKHVGTQWMSDDPDAKQVFKKLKNDPNNPFGAAIKMKDGKIVGQRDYISKDGTKHLSPVNIVNEEGDWGEWSKTLASQMLSKQPIKTAQKQLKLALDEKNDEYNDYISITNPVVKKKFLEEFADSCDSAAVELKAAALPRQQSHVILPVPSMRTNEIYAPNYKDGTQVVLIRYPHAGQFEIPQLTVNNKQKEAKGFMFNARDAVGINAKVAEQLSGADFDGDTVLVIPVISPSGQRLADVRTQKPRQGLVDFDPKESFPGYKGMKPMGDQTKQREMGMVSNLITDMTIKGAPPDEIERAVKHSMVVIDAQKHKLDYKASEKAFRIDELKKRYQNGGGASTIISRASAEKRVPVRKELYSPKKWEEETGQKWNGEKLYKETPEFYTKTWTTKKGEPRSKEVERFIKSTQMAETSDARTLIGSPFLMEAAYASYANSLKELANKARLEAYNTKPNKYDPSAKKVYEKEIISLNDKLIAAKKNAPRERQAQILAGEIFKAELKSDPEMDKEHQKKIKSQALANARNLTGAKKQKVVITDDEWKAIQSNAISSTKVREILDNADDEEIKKLAMPRQTNTLSDAKVQRIKSMHNSGFVTADIAETLGVSPSTISKIISGKE